MSFNVANVGGTMTGGANVALTSAGVTQNGKVSFTTPSSTRLTPEHAYFKVSGGDPGNATNPGTAKTVMSVAFADRSVAEGCCTANAGYIVLEAEVRWPLGLPEATLVEAYDLFRSIVNSAQFKDAATKGTLPA
jgi:hypothetical protein